MKVYYNSNYELTSYDTEIAYRGSSIYNKLYVSVPNSLYAEISEAGGTIYPSYSAKLPNGRIVGELSMNVGAVDGDNYTWSITLADSVLAVTGQVEITITFKIKTSSTAVKTTYRAGKVILPVYDAVVSTNNIVYVSEGEDENDIITSLKDEIDAFDEDLSNKADKNGNAGLDFAVDELTANGIESGDIVPETDADHSVGTAENPWNEGHFGTIYEGGKSLSAKYHPINGDYAQPFKASSVTIGDPDKIVDEPYISITNEGIKIEDYGGTLFKYDSINATFWVGGTTTLAVLNVNGKSTFKGSTTFEKSPVVPTPTNNTDATNKTYVDTQDASILADSKEYADTFGKSLAMDSSTYVISLKDANGNTLSSVDLPLETMVVNASYSNGYITLKLKNGNTLTFSVSDLISGLATKSYVDTQDSTYDAKAIHIAGEETITGSKTFGNSVYAYSSYLRLKNTKGGYVALCTGYSTTNTYLTLPQETGVVCLLDWITPSATDYPDLMSEIEEEWE